MAHAPFILKADVQQMAAQSQLDDDPGIIEGFVVADGDSGFEYMGEALRPMIAKPAEATPFSSPSIAAMSRASSTWSCGSGLVTGGQLVAEEREWHGQPWSVELTLPPLAVVWLTPQS